MQSADDVRSLGAFEAQAAQLAGEAQQQAYELNALINEDNAKLALRTGLVNQYDAQRAAERNTATAAGQYASRGVNISTGTPLLVLSTLASEGAMEAVKLKHESEDEARNLRNDAIVQRYYGQQALVTGAINAQGARLRSEAQANSIERQAKNSLMNGIGSMFGSLFGGM